MLRLRFAGALAKQTKSSAALSSIRSLSAGSNSQEQDENHPIKRSLNILKNDMKRVTNFFKTNSRSNRDTDNTETEYDLKDKLKRFQGSQSGGPSDETFQSHCDVVVIGGGGVGSSVAYWLKEKAREGLNVVVVERDPTYERASTTLSVGGLRQQFSLPENIQMSLYGAEFIRECKEHLGDCELNFTPHGYLVLASEEGAETLMRNSKLQNELGARNELLNSAQLKAKFPWMNTEGVVLEFSKRRAKILKSHAVPSLDTSVIECETKTANEGEVANVYEGLRETEKQNDIPNSFEEKLVAENAIRPTDLEGDRFQTYTIFFKLNGNRLLLSSGYLQKHLLEAKEIEASEYVKKLF